MPNAEISLTNGGWGGDFQTDSTGDLLLAVDAQNNPVATQQRVYRLLMTSPRQFNEDTNTPASVPDDLFAPGYGAGLRLNTGQMITPGLLGQIESQIEAGLQTDPTVVSSPPPDVDIAVVATNTLQITLSCTAVSGEVVPIPSFELPLSGGP